MKNILVIVPYKFCPPINGGTNLCYYFSEYLSKTYSVVTVGSDNNDCKDIPFKLLKFFKDIKYKYFNVLILCKLFLLYTKKNIDTCILHQPFMGLLILPFVKLLGIRLIVCAHNVEYLRFKSIGKWWSIFLFVIEYVVYKNADKTLFVSREDIYNAIRLFGLRTDNCLFSPQGTTYNSTPSMTKETRADLWAKHGIDRNCFVIIFFANLYYLPNIEALNTIIEKISPILCEKADFPYRIVICGSGLPQNHILYRQKIKHVEYLGFVDDITSYILAADLMLNPVIKGGGAKSKVIEAISLGKTVLSSQSGAIGIEQAVCGDKLIVIDDKDFEKYYENIKKIRSKSNDDITSANFYQTYYWGNIVKVLGSEITKNG